MLSRALNGEDGQMLRNDANLSLITISLSILMSSTKTMFITIMLCLQRRLSEERMRSIAITQDHLMEAE